MKYMNTRLWAIVGLSLICSAQAVAAERTCSDEISKAAIATKAQNSRGEHVKMYERMGRDVTATFTGADEIETLSKKNGRTKCFAKAKFDSNMGALKQPMWLTYTIGTHDDGKPYTDVRVLSADERQKFERDR